MKDLLFTLDGRYVLGFNTIVDVETGFSTDIHNPNPLFVCEMFKNEFSFAYKNSLMESKDLFGKMRKLIYRLMESDTNMIMEYEVKFGQNMIFESNKSIFTEHRIKESWDYIKNLLIKQHPILLEGFFGNLWDKTKEVAGKAWDKTKEIAGDAWDKVKQAGAWVISKGIPWVMTKIEHFMMSPEGIGLDVALTALGIGKIATGVIWGILLVWKVYQLIDGQLPADSVWSYIDIAVCLAGLVFSGAAKSLKTAFKAVGGNVAKVGGKVLQPIVTVLSKTLGGIMSLLVKPLEWIAKIFGPKASAMVSSFKGRIGTILEKMKTIFTPAAGKVAGAETKSLTSMVKNYIKKDFINPAKAVTAASARKAALKGTKWGVGMYGGIKAIEMGAEMHAKRQAEKQAQSTTQLASLIPDETIKQGVEGDMSSLLNQMQ